MQVIEVLNSLCAADPLQTQDANGLEDFITADGNNLNNNAPSLFQHLLSSVELGPF